MTYFPAWTTGLLVSSGKLLKGQTEVIYKQQNTYRTTNTFLIDPELQVELEANAVYWVEFYVHATAISTGAGIRTNWATPTTATGLKECVGVDQGVTLDNTGSPGGGGTPRLGVHQFGSNIGYGFRSPNNSYQFSIIERGLLSTGVGPGTLALNWAQIASDAADSSIQAGSHLTVRRLA